MAVLGSRGRRQAGWARAVPAAPIAALVLALAAGCGRLPPPPLRPDPVPYADTRPIPEPGARAYSEPAELFESGIVAPVGRALEPRRWAGRIREALNVTRMDEVVASAWFEPRNSARPMTPEEVARGPAGAPGRAPTGPLRIVAPKGAGIMPGFWVEDARGHRWLVKLDPPGHPRLAGGAAAVTARLLHAAGYHVPQEHAVTIDPARLSIAPGVEVSEEGRRRSMRWADVEVELARGARLPDGRVTGAASLLLPGTPKGPWRFEGRRADDPNDHYRHEHRRELRGLHVVAAWLDHIDLRFDNTLSIWIEPPGHLRHYLIDFGSALGSGGVRPHRPREGAEHNVDLWASLARLATLGLYRVGWEGEPGRRIHPSIGWLRGEDFDPGAWKPNWPNEAWARLTPADGYWAAKLVASFTDEQLAAAVGAADLPAEAEEALTAILAARRDRVVAYWYSRVTPLERPRVEAEVPSPRETRAPVGMRAPAGTLAPAEGTTRSPAFVLSFEDLGLETGEEEATSYAWELRHDALDRRWRGESAARGPGRQRVRVAPAPPAPGSADGVAAPPAPPRADGAAAPTAPDDPAAYAVLRLRARRIAPEGRSDRSPVTIWLHWRGPEAGYRVAALRH